MGAVPSKYHDESFDIDRFNNSIATLKSWLNYSVSDDNDLIHSVQRCYSDIDLNNDDHVIIDLYNANIEKVIDSAKYYLNHYQKAHTFDKKNNNQCTNNLIHNCNQDSCVFDPSDIQQQIHFILHHPSQYISLRRRRLYRFTYEWNISETETETVTENNTDDIEYISSGSETISNTSESEEKEFDYPKTMPNKALPVTPTKTRSLSFMENSRNRDVFNRKIYSSKSPPPPISYDKALPAPQIKPSTTSMSPKTDDGTASDDSAFDAPLLHRNENHVSKLIMKSAEDLPQISSKPPKPRRIQKKRSETTRISAKTCKQILEDKCIEGNKCIRLRVFLTQIQGKKLMKDDMIKNGFNKKHYKHCRKYHNEYKGICDAENECIWNEENNSEIYLIHGHYFHKIPYCIKKKAKYKQTLSLLLKNNKKYSTLKQLDFGYKFEIQQKYDSFFQNPKDEILHNKYNPLKNKEWNDLLKKTVYYYKRKEAKRISLSMKEILCLKLYTDFDALQRNFRKCFRDKNKNERRKRQRSFYHWYKEIVKACNKSKDIISNKIYHGVDIQLPPSTFFGVYYGPVSTTINWDIAAGFAGNAGQVIELYPSFGKKGLNVSFLSNFPEEKEILYVNCSFQIANIFKCDAVEIGIINPTILSNNEIKSIGVNSVKYMEHCIIKAIQMISIDSQIISLNDTVTLTNNIGFNTLESPEKICILYLLYLQYRIKEWKTFCQQSADHIHIALAKYRDMFISLVTNVKAVRMEKLSKLLQIFFYTDQEHYTFPILSENNEFKMNDINKQCEDLFKPNQPLKFETICLLFPNAKQISINAENWDFSLNVFIQFLQIFDLNYANVALQDIYVRFVINDGKIMNDERKARKLRHKYTNFKQNERKLRKLGWSLVSPSHLHRVGFEPLPELPFLRLFVPPQKNTLAPVLFRTYSTRFSIATYLSELQKDEFKNCLNNENEGEIEEVGELEDREIVLIDHNPKNCILSNDIFDTLQYKNKLIKLLKWRKNDTQNVLATDQLQKKFVICCYMVRVVVLDPLPNELKHIFCIQKNNNKTRISFENICVIFPCVEDIFLRNTTFNLSILYPFVQFIKNSNKSVSKQLKLERIFFSKDKPMKHRDLIAITNQLNDIGWDFVEYEQTVFKKY